jgi:hypothetical protein
MVGEHPVKDWLKFPDVVVRNLPIVQGDGKPLPFDRMALDAGQPLSQFLLHLIEFRQKFGISFQASAGTFGTEDFESMATRMSPESLARVWSSTMGVRVPS